MFIDFARHAVGDAVWSQRRIDASSVTVPTFCVGGWRDKNAAAIARTYEQIQGPKKLLIGPWMHTTPQDASFEAIDFLPIPLRWSDHWLRGVHNGVMDDPPVTLFVEGARCHWRAFESWPPARGELDLVTGK
ncbi:MAG: uncharacterized protein V7607_4999 [Solirubrobacteraceae bacterium]